MEQLTTDLCGFDGHAVWFFKSRGCALPNGRWLIRCPDLTDNQNQVIDKRSVLNVIQKAFNALKKEQRREVALVQLRPHQAVGLFLEKVITDKLVERAVEADGSIYLKPVHIGDKNLTIQVVRILPSDKSVVLADKDGRPLHP